jgi:hypothetical protein
MKTTRTISIVALCAFLTLAACHSKPSTDVELLAKAHEAVDRKLDKQARFSLEESSVAHQIACGHADTDGDDLGRDFVYRDGTLIMDNDPAFDAAAAQCDATAGDQANSSAAS